MDALCTTSHHARGEGRNWRKEKAGRKTLSEVFVRLKTTFDA
jgi:hypothetical protein